MPPFNSIVRFLIVLCLLAATSRHATAQPADPPSPHVTATGRVLDALDRPIVGATVSVEALPDLAPVTTDARGRYAIADVPIGAALVITAQGYQAGLATVGRAAVDDVVLLTDRQATEVIEVRGEAPPATPGAAMLDRNELHRVPGTGNDLVRTLSALPGVVNFPFPLAYNGLVIRGAAPADSKFLVDDFEVPLLYHDIGFRSIIPTEAIDTLEFVPGGFDVRYGRAASGIVALTTRAGSDQRSEQLEGSVIDAGAVVQGATGRTHYMVAFRRSLVDLILPALLPSDADLSLTTVPRYYDEQIRVDYALSSRWQLAVSSIGSDDALELFVDKTANRDKRFYSRTRFVRVIGSARWHDGPWSASIGISPLAQQFVFERGIYQYIDVGQLGVTTRGELTRSAQHVAGLADLQWRVGGTIDTQRYDLAIAQPPQPREGQPQGGLPDPKDTSNRFRGIAWTPDAAAWTALTAGLTPAIHATAGLRVDAFGRNGDVAVEPRGELQLKVAPPTTLRLSAGAYRRPAEDQEELIHPELHPERATQLIAGVIEEPIDGLRVQTSAYYTDRSRLVMRVDGRLGNTGSGTTYGAELLATLRHDAWFAWISYSYSHSTRIDSPGAPSRLFAYDQPHSLNVAASWRHGRWQLGGRFQLYSGLPQTPVIASIYDSDTNYYTPIYGAPFSQRAPLHHQLDLRLDRAWQWGPVKLNYFLDVQNVYLDQSTIGYVYSYDYTQRSAFKSLPIIPSAGIRGTL